MARMMVDVVLVDHQLQTRISFIAHIVGNIDTLRRPDGIYKGHLTVTRLPNQSNLIQILYQILQNEVIHGFISHNASLVHLPVWQLCLIYPKFRVQNDIFKLSFEKLGWKTLVPLKLHKLLLSLASQIKVSLIDKAKQLHILLPICA